MTSYIIESVDKAAKKTRELLLPFDLSTWSKLALIVLLTGGISFPGFPGGGGDYQYDGSQSDLGQTSDMDFSQLTGAFGASNLLYLGVAAIIGVMLVLLFISSVFEFIYYRSLIDKDVVIRENFSDNLERGARYFNFRVLYGLMLLLLSGASIGLVMLNPLIIIPLIFAFIPLAILLYAFNILVHDFVLLEMLQEDRKFIESLRIVLGYVREDLRNTVFYLIVRFVVNLLAATAIGIGTMLLLIIVAVPLVILGALLFMISELLIIPVIIFGIFLAVVVALFVSVPLKTFIYYYAITVYGEISKEK